MWVAKIKLQHDCIIGNRCKKYKCTSVGYPLDYYTENNNQYYLHFEKLIGDPKNIKKFITDLKKDKSVENFETQNNILFFTYKTKVKGSMPTQQFKKITFLKPVRVDTQGVEHWEIGAWKKEELMQYLKELQTTTKNLQQFQLQKITRTKFNDIHFPHILPIMTETQQRSLQLAQQHGYYEFPRKIELAQLAKLMNISTSTYHEHLRKAERAILKDY